MIAGAVALGMSAAPFMASTAFAQSYTSGGIAGVVVDGTGAPVSGATVTVTSNAQGFSRTVTTNGAGQFRAPSLPTGGYTVEISSGSGSAVDDSVRVAVGVTSDYSFVVGVGDEVVATGVLQSVGFSDTTIGVNVDVETLLKTTPIGRDITSVTLLAPGAVLGDSTFGRLPALGGASVAENAYYVNGLNITNFDTYLGGSLIPFEFYKNVDVKTGGYAAEFGRATGGIVNAVTKSGTNEWKGAVHLNWEPDALRNDSPDTPTNANHNEERENFSTTVELGGPLIEDRLFVYGLVEMRNNERQTGRNSGTHRVDDDNGTFWGAKVDAIITDEHRLEFTYFDTTRTTARDNRAYNPATDTIGASNSSTFFDFGGVSYVAKYTGDITDWLTISAAYGQNKDREEVLSNVSDISRAFDVRTGFSDLSPQTTSNRTFPRKTKREFFRGDADMTFSAFGDHHVRVGFDLEKLDLAKQSVRNGSGPFPFRYEYRTASAATAQVGGDLAIGQDYVVLNHFDSGGNFFAENLAYYIQDEWDVNDRLTLNLGLRADNFANFTANGSQFIDFNNQLGPRLGFSYDPTGDGNSKFYANFGTYYLPVASNTSFRQGAAEFFIREYWTFTGIGANGVPVLDTQITSWTDAQPCIRGLAGATGTVGCSVTGDGSTQDTRASISGNLKATKQNEFLVGYDRELDNDWSVGVSYIHRDLVATAEDAAVDDYINNYCVAEGIAGCDSIWSGFHQYTILNPGEDATITFADPINGETTLRTVTFTAAELGIPKATRTYDAVTFNFARAFDGIWGLEGNYTWSRSYGNSEGYVQSDFGQDDAGITQDFDKKGFTDFATGHLPNNRTHTFNLRYNRQVMEDLLVGVRASASSPRKLSCFGLHPDSGPSPVGPGVLLNLYGAASHFCGEAQTPSPRGTASETDWVKSLDLSARYEIDITAGSVMTLRADVFNVLNGAGVISRDEFSVDGGGTARARYDSITGHQAPRTVRLGVDIEF